jgi:hypothetical protein
MPAVEWPETEARMAEVARTKRGRHRDKALASYRRSRALELRARGLSYEEIAREVGYTSRATAHNVITQALESRQAENVEHLRRLELDRLDGMHASLWPRAMDGHVPSVLALLRVIDLRTRLLGLAPAGSGGKRRPEDAWPSCHGPATVVVHPDDWARRLREAWELRLRLIIITPRALLTEAPRPRVTGRNLPARGQPRHDEYMDVPWALAHLDYFVDMTTLQWPTESSFIGDDRQTRAKHDDIIRAAHIVERILDRVLPDWRTTVPADSRHRWEQTREAAARAATQLRGDEELKLKLGDSSPRVSLGGLHPWVWDTARSLWEGGAYRLAVAQAAASLNAHIQAKVGRADVADDALVGEVFSDREPTADKARLRLPGADLDRTQDSRQRGARALGQGCFWALRNPATHRMDEWDEQHALEALCTLSVFARLVDECEVVRA